jgi:hypothetical protein
MAVICIYILTESRTFINLSLPIFYYKKTKYVAFILPYPQKMLSLVLRIWIGPFESAHEHDTKTGA